MGGAKSARMIRASTPSPRKSDDHAGMYLENCFKILISIATGSRTSHNIPHLNSLLLKIQS